VVANACTDDTLERLVRFRPARYVQKILDGLPLAWIEVPIPRKSNALKQAFPFVRSDLVTFVDDDHRVDQDYPDLHRGVCAST